MKYHIIDTNVLMVANEGDRPEQADEACVLKCIERLQEIRVAVTEKKQRVVLEDRILSEYYQTLQSSREPSVGHEFYKWLMQVAWNHECVDRVAITCRDEANQVFDEFPNHQALANFDVSDRKFVATSHAHPEKPPILQAVDVKWKGWESAWMDCGIHLEWVCPKTAERLYRDHIAGK